MFVAFDRYLCAHYSFISLNVSAGLYRCDMPRVLVLLILLVSRVDCSACLRRGRARLHDLLCLPLLRDLAPVFVAPRVVIHLDKLLDTLAISLHHNPLEDLVPPGPRRDKHPHDVVRGADGKDADASDLQNGP